MLKSHNTHLISLKNDTILTGGSPRVVAAARAVAVQHSICIALVSVPCPLRGWRGACLRLGPVCFCFLFRGPGPSRRAGGGPLSERLKTLGPAPAVF